MSQYKPDEAKREEFRRYLERCGVLDALTKVLVLLYEEMEKPEDALEYIRKYLAGITDALDMQELEKKLEDVELENRDLKSKLAKLDTSGEE